MEGDADGSYLSCNRRHFNPLPPHGGRHCEVVIFKHFVDISIHSLRMEGDVKGLIPKLGGSTISIHSLRMEGDNFELPTNGTR